MPTDPNADPAPKLSEEQLRSIYPTPTTYDEKLAERAEIHAIHRSWLPKHPKWQITGLIAALIVGLMAIGYIAIGLMLSNPLLGVPLITLLSLLWAYAFRATIITIRTYNDTDFT